MIKRISFISRLSQSRDELSFKNIRSEFWPALLVLPLSVIVGNLRYYDHSIAIAGFEINVLMYFLLGLGWLVVAVTPKKLIIPLLRISTIISAVLASLMVFMPLGFWHFVLYMSSRFLNGLCAACAFYLFCFVLNNIERLFCMAIIQIYYGFYYAAWTTFPVIHAAATKWSSIILTVVLLIAVFSIKKRQTETNTESNGKGSGVPFVVALGVIHYMIMCMSNYIEWAENAVSALAFGLGFFISVGLIIILQLFNSRNAMYIWFLFLAFTLLGLGALLFDNSLTFILGSLTYGLGDSLGYIVICYICAGAIKRSKSLRMFRLYCLVSFAEYIIISGLFSFFFNNFQEPNKYPAFGIVLVLVCLCLFFMPLIQKRLFDADWTDGLYLRDMEEYSHSIAATVELNTKDQLNLTPREEEIFTMLLHGTAPKEIAHTLKISYHTEHFHQKNLYRKLGIQSRAELFAKYTEKMEKTTT